MFFFVSKRVCYQMGVVRWWWGYYIETWFFEKDRPNFQVLLHILIKVLKPMLLLDFKKKRRALHKIGNSVKKSREEGFYSYFEV